MSFIIKGNILKNTCRIGVTILKNNTNLIAPKLCKNIAIKTLRPVLLQTRFYSDDINKNKLETIYTGKLSNNVKRIKTLSLTTSALGLSLQPFLLPKIIETGSTTALISAVVTFGFFTIGTPLLLHMILRKYVTDIKYDSINKKYIATTYSLFVRPKLLEFTVDDVEQCGLGPMITTCYAKGKPIFLDAESFTDVKYYANIMGYDKPMNFNSALNKINNNVIPPKK